jgi:hypothetical protein
VFLSVAYEPDIEFGTFKFEADAEQYRSELINEANMSHYQDIEVGVCYIWHSVKEMRDYQASEIAKWNARNPTE